MKENKKIGRPSKFAESLKKAKEYLNGGYEQVGEVIPNIAGLACYLGISRSTVYEYQKESEEFSDILEAVLSLQESKLVNSGLTGAFNSTIAKLILTKHGYSDKQELTGANGQAIKIDKKPDLSNLSDEELELYERLAILRSERDKTGEIEA